MSPYNQSLHTTTWRCAPLDRVAPLPVPVAIYALGPWSEVRISTFAFTPATALGDIYVVRSATAASQPKFKGDRALVQRRCRRVSSKISAVAMRTDHYHGAFARHKLNLLDHLPRGLEAVVLMDHDTFCIGPCVQALSAHLAKLDAQQWVIAGQTGIRQPARTDKRCTPRHGVVNQHQCPRGVLLYGIAPPDDKINSGVLVLNLTRFREFAERLVRTCTAQGQEWWWCVMSRRSSSDWPTADQSVWDALIQLHPHIWYRLPCGAHAETEVLKGIALRLGVPSSMDRERPHFSPFSPLCNASKEAGGPVKASFWRTADDCASGVDTSAPGNLSAASILAALRARVVVAHGAAHMQPLAVMVARRLLSAQPSLPAGTPCACIDSTRNARRYQMERSGLCRQPSDWRPLVNPKPNAVAASRTTHQGLLGGHDRGGLQGPGVQPPRGACSMPSTERTFNSLIQRLFAANLVPNGSMVDAGAHLGRWSCFYAEQAPDRVVHALEPLGSNVKRIRRSYGRTHPTIRARLAGLGSRHTWRSTPCRPAGSQLDPLHPAANFSAAARCSFEVFRMDDLFAQEQLGFVHLDVEGDELAVIRGGRAVLRRDMPLLTTELTVHADLNYSRTLLHEVASLGYASFLVEEHCGWPRQDCRNLVHVRRSQAAALRSLWPNQPSSDHAAVVEVGALDIDVHAYPGACRRGGTCCGRRSPSWSCCKPSCVDAWLKAIPREQAQRFAPARLKSLL